MYCQHCDRRMERCICLDADERIANLKNCKHLDQRMIERLEAERLLAKYEIEEDRKNQTK